MSIADVKALTFDVFGTVVDWRGGIARAGLDLGRAQGIDRDWYHFADRWRARYQPAMARVRGGERPWIKLDDLHRENLEDLLEEFEITGLGEAEKAHLNRAWHRLPPWPEAVAGLTRLKRKYILATQSNGNIALMVNMAKHTGLPWDVVLGAEITQAYKPQPECYLRAAAALGLEPGECLMTAAHNNDLLAARACGFQTAFVCRPHEYGPDGTPDLEAAAGIDIAATDFNDLAAQLGC